MRLGLNLGYWGPGSAPTDLIENAALADRLGFDSVWAAEAYGSDAVTVLSWVGARTERVKLGSAVLQIPARTPAMTAMTAATLDTLSGGRFQLGLGVSGPQVSEGWHGVRFEAPLARTREYVEVVRMVLARQTVEHSGRFWSLPLPDGPGKALRLTIRGHRADLPLYLAAVGPKNLQLTGEIADGWLAIFYSPEHSGDLLAAVEKGRRASGRAEPTAPMSGFDVVATVPVVLHDDLERAAEAVRPYCALYVGGMGSREKNFYNRLACRMGYEEQAARIQDLFLAGRHREAAAAVPFEFIDETALIGPADRIASRIGRYADAGVTTLAVAPHAPTGEGQRAVLAALAEMVPGTD
ncbi:MAG: LLM class F420-dependent oxidoreductase [Intrasporangium sp.]|uniref:LLM class F420-dependent oxidoreductase n=1 Tax=Intrasporangium sp. TaxID=1925024 RepID=UPI0026493384|nr:LLM class F420-dependent oxidoreductase [Intrasporangium sp.]MDN5794658.1 LLM class F420-dependent oxidoreductase [Intrasporangium sp.]